MEKVAIFADVQNIYYTVRETFNRYFDYLAFWAEATYGRDVVFAAAYAIDKGDPQQQKFQRGLTSIGFKVKLKPFIQRQDGSAKGDWDVGITIDILEQAPYVDRVILLSGDGDFSILMEHIKIRDKVEIDVYGVSPLTADSLIKSADHFSAIDGAFLR